MDAVCCPAVPLRSLPAQPRPRPSWTSHDQHHSRRRSVTLFVSCCSYVRFFLPASPSASASVSSRVRRPLAPSLRRRTRLSPRPLRRASVIASGQFNVAKVLATAWRVAKDGVEAGTNLVPDSVPRPIARIGVAVVAGTVALFLLKSLLSTVLFVLAMMGLIYFTYMAFNAGEGSSGGPRGDEGSTSTATDEETLEEARRIMEKYK